MVLREEAKGKTTKNDIIDFMKDRFARWQLPDEILIVDEIAKTSVGKYDKKVLREQYESLYAKE